MLQLEGLHQLLKYNTPPSFISHVHCNKGQGGWDRAQTPKERSGNGVKSKVDAVLNIFFNRTESTEQQQPFMQDGISTEISFFSFFFLNTSVQKMESVKSLKNNMIFPLCAKYFYKCWARKVFSPSSKLFVVKGVAMALTDPFSPLSKCDCLADLTCFVAYIYFKVDYHGCISKEKRVGVGSLQ